MRLGTLDPTQGAVVLVEVTAPGVGEVTGELDGRPLRFWRTASAGGWRALLGVDLEREPDTATLVLGRGGAGPPCAIALDVEEGAFPVRNLRLPKGYVDLTPENLARAEREAERLEAAFAEVTPRRLWRGGFRLPLPGVQPSRNFGQKRILNGEPRSPHSGIDFGARAGTRIRAPQAGRVVLVDRLFFSGLTIVLDHGLGLFSFYGHLSSAGVRPGQVLEAGSTIGRVGASGRATGPHLHWSIRLNGARVNPLDLVALPLD